MYLLMDQINELPSDSVSDRIIEMTIQEYDSDRGEGYDDRSYYLKEVCKEVTKKHELTPFQIARVHDDYFDDSLWSDNYDGPTKFIRGIERVRSFYNLSGKTR